MNATFVLLSALVFCSLYLGIASAKSRDETRIHGKEEHNRLHHKSRHAHHGHETAKHHLGVSHHFRHHKAVKTRDSSNSTTCINLFELELIAIAKWLNNTQELKLIFAFIPPSVKQLIIGNITTRFNNISDSNLNITWNNDNSTVKNPNITLLNGSVSVDLNLFYDATVEWPILTYFARLVGYFLSRAQGLSELFRSLPVFRDIWRIILRGLLRGADRAEVLVENIRDLFGFKGNITGNLFNFTYWDQVWSPSGIANVIEGDIQSLANLTGLFK